MRYSRPVCRQDASLWCD